VAYHEDLALLGIREEVGVEEGIETGGEVLAAENTGAEEATHDHEGDERLNRHSNLCGQSVRSGIRKQDRQG